MRIVDTFKFYTPQTTNKLLVFGLTHKAILLKRREFAQSLFAEPKLTQYCLLRDFSRQQS